MIGLSALAARLAGSGNDELVLWLDMGLRALAPQDSAEGAELAFAPLLLSRAQPPMQQFHAAVDALPGAVQARLRWACGRLLDSLRLQDDHAYARSVWALAIAFKPPSGVLAAARRYVASLPDDRHELEVRRPAIDALVSAVLSYPRSTEQDDFMVELKRLPLWSRAYTQQYVVFLIRDNPRAWVTVIRCFQDELRPLAGGHSGYFRRLTKAIGPTHLARNIGALNTRDGLDWLQRSMAPFFRLVITGSGVRAEVGTQIVHLDDDEFEHWAANDDAQDEAIFGVFSRPRIGEASQAQARLGLALSDTPADQIIRAWIK